MCLRPFGLYCIACLGSLLKHVIERKIEGMSRRGRRRTQLLDDCKEKSRYWNLKVRGLWGNRFGRGETEYAINA